MRPDLFIDPIKFHLASSYSPEATLHLLIKLFLAGAHHVGFLSPRLDLGLELGYLVILLVRRIL